MSCFALLLWAALARAWQAQQAVVFYEDGRVQAAQGLPRKPEPETAFAWAWSPAIPPRRVQPEVLAEPLRSRSATSLTVQVKAGPGAEVAGLRLLAGPREMWREVPESLLPAWPVPASGKVVIPVDAARPWRLRLAGPRAGSWWLDLPPGRRRCEMAALPVASVEIAVQGNDGGALPGAGLRALSGNPGLWRSERGELGLFRADFQGRIAVQGLPDREELAWLAGSPDHPPFALRSLPSRLPAFLVLPAGRRLAGRVVDGSGRPLAGVTVGFRAFISPEVTRAFGRRTKSHADGDWILSGVPTGPASLTADLAGWAPFQTLVGPGDSAVDLGRVILSRGGTIAVEVVDDLGQPVPEARVRAEEGGDEALAGPTGRAELRRLPTAVPVRLRGEAVGHLAGHARFDPPWPAAARLVLQRAVTLVGRFLDPDGGAPLAASVTLEAGTRSSTGELEADGSFRLTVPPGLDHTLVFASSEAQDHRLPVAAGAPGERRDLGELRARAGAGVSGRLIDGRTGEPVAGGQVWIPKPGRLGPLLAWSDGAVLTAASGADGGFRLRGLTAGSLSLRIETPGFARRRLAVEPAEGTTIDLGEIPLSQGSTVRIHTGEKGGEGLAARLDLGEDGLPFDRLSGPVEGGMAILERVPAGPARLLVVRGDTVLCRKAVRVPEDQVGYDVECPAAGIRVHGEVRVGGRPAGSGTLLWLPEAAKVAEGVTTLFLPGGLSQQQLFRASEPQVSAVVSPAGRFVSTDLYPGPWTVSWMPEGGGASEPLAVELAAADDLQIPLTFPGETLDGRVLDEQDRPVVGARVRDTGNGLFAFTRENGEFSFSGLAAKTYWLEAAAGELESEPLAVAIGQDEPPALVTLVVERARRRPGLEIEVVDPAGRPTAAAFVFVETPDQGVQLLSADTAGRVRFLRSPPYPAAVRAAAFAAGAWTFGGWTAWSRAQEGVRLVLGPGGTLALTSRKREGAPRVLAPGGWEVSTLSALLGQRPFLSPQAPFRLSGLPEGEYGVELAGATAHRWVRTEEPAELEIE
jgi:hypothetical protein